MNDSETEVCVMVVKSQQRGHATSFVDDGDINEGKSVRPKSVHVRNSFPSMALVISAGTGSCAQAEHHRRAGEMGEGTQPRHSDIGWEDGEVILQEVVLQEVQFRGWGRDHL